MYHLDNGQRSYNFQTKLAERMICLAVHRNSPEYTFEYVGAEKMTTKKVGLRHLLSHTKLLLSITYELK